MVIKQKMKSEVYFYSGNLRTKVRQRGNVPGYCVTTEPWTNDQPASVAAGVTGRVYILHEILTALGDA